MISTATVKEISSLPNYESVKVYLEGDLRKAKTIRIQGVMGAHVDDVNADGHLDLVLARETQLSILQGHGDGSFDEALEIPIGRRPAELITTDVNRDGITDIVTIDNSGFFGFSVGANSFSVTLGRPDGGYEPATFHFLNDNGFRDLNTMDVDDDGDEDLLLVNASGVNILLNHSPRLGDFNADGTVDLADVEGLAQSGRYQSDLPATFTEGDWNGDGVFDQQDLNQAIRRGASDEFVAALAVAVAEESQTNGDFDGDGAVSSWDIDLLFAATRADDSIQTDSFDLNEDAILDRSDADVWITEIGQTRYGDTNLDLGVDFEDFLTVSANFGRSAATWAEGDFTGDGKVGFGDFLLLSAVFDELPE